MQPQLYIDREPRTRIVSRPLFDQRPSRTSIPRAICHHTRRYRPSKFCPPYPSSSSFLSSSFQLHKPLLRKSLDPTATNFEPYSTEPQHGKALSSIYEPFWHQYPDWTQATSTDTKPVIIGFGPAALYELSAPTDIPIRRQFVPELVDVYNADEFVQTVPITLLMRFSSTAVEMVSRSIVMSNAGSKIASLTRSTGQPASRQDSAYYGSPRQVADSRNAAPSIISLPPPIVPTAPGGRKDLRLFLDAPEMPSNEAVVAALKWMKDNEEVNGYDPFLDYGPSSLGAVQLVDLIDCYQAALCFQLRPFPKRIRSEILDRLTRNRPDVNIFHQLSRFLPLDDPAITRVINSYHDFWRAGQYSTDELDAFSVFRYAKENRDFNQRCHQIFKSRRVAYAKHFEATQEAKVVEGHGMSKRNGHLKVEKETSRRSPEGRTEPKTEDIFRSGAIVKSRGAEETKQKLTGTVRQFQGQTKQAAKEETTEGPKENAVSNGSSLSGKATQSLSVNARRRNRRAAQARAKALAAGSEA